MQNHKIQSETDAQERYICLLSVTPNRLWFWTDKIYLLKEKRLMRRLSAIRETQLDEQTEEALVASKVDYLAEEYSQLLVSQLDQQRSYYEGLLKRRDEEAEASLQCLHDACKASESAVKNALKEAGEAESARHAATHKLVSVFPPLRLHLRSHTLRCQASKQDSKAKTTSPVVRDVPTH